MEPVIFFACGALFGAAVAGIIFFVCHRQGSERALGAISEQLRAAADTNKLVQDQNQKVIEVTNDLNAALSNPIVRGDWGDRMVEDVLRPIGFVEGRNYRKQETMDCRSRRPDYTFLLPRKLKVNLDAKFPWDNYRNHYNATTESEKEQYLKRFLGDVKARVKELAAREYINPSEGTLDFVLMFVPNEGIYSFVNQHDPDLFDFALSKKVVLCSPWSLYPVLSIIRRAVDNFVLERNTAALLPLLTDFENQWQKYKDCQEKMGQKIENAREEFGQLVGTRERQLSMVLKKIELLKQRTDFHAADDGKAEVLTGSSAPRVESPHGLA